MSAVKMAVMKAMKQVGLLADKMAARKAQKKVDQRVD